MGNGCSYGWDRAENEQNHGNKKTGKKANDHHPGENNSPVLGEAVSINWDHEEETLKLRKQLCGKKRNFINVDQYIRE
jgi:hypothetical protein